jgi:hypothetical protein
MTLQLCISVLISVGIVTSAATLGNYKLTLLSSTIIFLEEHKIRSGCLRAAGEKMFRSCITLWRSMTKEYGMQIIFIVSVSRRLESQP